MTPPEDSFNLQVEENTVIVSFSDGYLLYERAYDLKDNLQEKILRTLEKERCEKVKIDLGKVNKIDAAGINILISFKKEIEKRNKTFEISNVNSGYIKKIFAVTEADSWLNQQGSIQL